MPNSRYEREIEEILRNMERTEPKPSFRERMNMRRQARTKHPEDRQPRPARPSVNLNLSTSEWCFAVGILLGLIAGGIAFASGAANIVTGFLAVLAFICIIMGIVTPWRESRRSSYSSSWRNEPTPIRQSSLPKPFRFLVTQWRIFRLKMRYRRYKGD